MKNIAKKIYKSIENEKQRSAWDRGVSTYALELVEQLDEAISGGWFDEENLAAPKMLEKALLNGARDWKEYSYGGYSLIYDGDIAERLCTPSELKKTRGGERNPSNRETWLDVQARALYQACRRVKRHTRHILTTVTAV